MTSTITKTLIVLFLAVGALGCDPYYRHHRYRDYYDQGYHGGYGQYSSPYYGRDGRDWGERHHHDD